MRKTERVFFSPYFPIFAAITLLIVPFPWLFGWFFAATVHEIFHCMAIWLCGEHIYQIQIGCTGAKIIAGDLTDAKTIICALAGPIGGFLLLFFAKFIPRVAVCAFFQSLFNMLPVYPLDGGRVLFSICNVFANIERK